MPMQRVLWRARLNNVRIVDDGGRLLRVWGTDLWINRGIALWFRYNRRESLIGKHVNVRIRQLVLDEGTENERIVWDAFVRGDILEGEGK